MTYDFDEIYAFEPEPGAFRVLHDRWKHSRVQLRPYGLADHTGTMTLYGSNDRMEASVHPDLGSGNHKAPCQFVEASAFFRDSVPLKAIVKLNCEGSEVMILRNLIASGEIWKIADVLIVFDIRGVSELAHQADEVLAELDAIGFTNYHLDDVLIGETHQERIRAWLSLCSW